MSPSDDSGVRLERLHAGRIALLVVDRPRARNALAPATIEALGAATAAIAADPPHALVLCGGGDHFIAGGDLRALAALRSAAQGAAISDALQGVLAQWSALPLPVIAAVDAFAIGGGAEVALACDLRVMSQEAFFAFRQVDFAVCTAWGGARRLRRLIGPSRALRLLCTGADVDAPAALAIGLADQIAPPGQSAREAALALALRLAERPPAVLAAFKALVQHEGSREHYQQLERAHFAELWGAEAHHQAVARYLDRSRQSRRLAAQEADDD